jgi:hypothetical protein
VDRCQRLLLGGLRDRDIAGSDAREYDTTRAGHGECCFRLKGAATQPRRRPTSRRTTGFHEGGQRPQGLPCAPDAGSARVRGSSGELEFADAAVSERELVPQRGDLFAEPLVVVERRSEPDADRFAPCALTHWEPRRRPLVAALPLDLSAQAGMAVEELAADPRADGDERKRDRCAFALEPTSALRARSAAPVERAAAALLRTAPHRLRVSSLVLLIAREKCGKPVASLRASQKEETMRLLTLFALLAVAAAGAAAARADVGPPWGPESPNFNLEAVLRPTAIGPDKGFGLIEFRQPNDANTIIYLDVWVRDLLPDHTYYVQRATDTSVDDDCTGSNWTMPTLGTITTDDGGTGRAALSRPLPASFLGSEFDIHFRIAETETGTSGVLESACYQYTVSQ